MKTESLYGMLTPEEIATYDMRFIKSSAAGRHSAV